MAGKNTDRNIVVGIDASRNRSGGARTHMTGVIGNLDPAQCGIKEVHLWSYRSLLDALPDRPWLHKHNPPELEGSLLAQLRWQLLDLDPQAKAVACDILFASDASTLSRFEPMVVLSQDMLSYEKGVMRHFGFSKARLRLLLILWLQNAAFRRAKGVLFLTRYAARTIQTSCGQLKRVAYAPHGIDDAFRRVPNVRKWPASERPITCTYVSNAEMYKHQWQVVEAISILRSRGHKLRLVLIGGGSGRAQDLLDHSVQKFDPQGEFTTQIQFILQKDLLTYLAETDIFIFASSCENLPITLLEGMASGLPIACSDRGPMPEVLQDAGTLFDPENPSSIAQAVEQLITNPARREDLARRARELADAYSWARCSHQTFEFITDTYFSHDAHAKS